MKHVREWIPLVAMVVIAIASVMTFTYRMETRFDQIETALVRL